MIRWPIGSAESALDAGREDTHHDVKPSPGDAEDGKLMLTDYITTVAARMAAAEATDRAGATLSLDEAATIARRTGAAVQSAGRKAVIVGNGGSLATASHFAIDFTKNGGLKTVTFADPTTLTCLGNDYGYEALFAKAVEMYAEPGDWLIAISCSGASRNVLSAVEAARAQDMAVMTLSGFSPGNPLRALGDLNFHVASHAYGVVEIAHMAILHGVLDLAMGWTPEAADAQPRKTWSAD